MVLRGDKENIAPSYLINEFLSTKIFLVGENVRPYSFMPLTRRAASKSDGPKSWPKV